MTLLLARALSYLLRQGSVDFLQGCVVLNITDRLLSDLIPHICRGRFSRSKEAQAC
jgi:hypothetical protein